MDALHLFILIYHLLLLHLNVNWLETNYLIIRLLLRWFRRLCYWLWRSLLFLTRLHQVSSSNNDNFRLHKLRLGWRREVPALVHPPSLVLFRLVLLQHKSVVHSHRVYLLFLLLLVLRLFGGRRLGVSWFGEVVAVWHCGVVQFVTAYTDRVFGHIDLFLSFDTFRRLCLDANGPHFNCTCVFRGCVDLLLWIYLGGWRDHLFLDRLLLETWGLALSCLIIDLAFLVILLPVHYGIALLVLRCCWQ